MIGQLFSVNLSNVVRAAMAEVMRDLASDAPVEITARQHDNGIDALILVAGHEIVVRESTIVECLKADDVRAAVQDLVGRLATKIWHFVDEALG